MKFVIKSFILIKIENAVSHKIVKNVIIKVANYANIGKINNNNSIYQIYNRLLFIFRYFLDESPNKICCAIFICLK